MLLNKGFSGEKLIDEFRVNLHPERLVLDKNGIFLISNDFGKVALNNLQVDERGLYIVNEQGAWTCPSCG